jgi:hypothetical protein
MKVQLFSVLLAVVSVSSWGLAGEQATSPQFGNGLGMTGSSRCTVGDGLGATLLFPYFEVDLEDPGGMTTLVSVNNGLDSPGLARVVLWTDWGVPTIAFDVFLNPHDIQTINLREIFNGQIPSTGESASVIGFPFCNILPPYHDNPAVSGGRLDQLKAGHTGKPGPVDGLCAGADHGDSIARGYITVDSVRQCSGLESIDPQNTPANPAILFFDNGAPGAMADNRNMLWGDSVFLDSRNNAAQGTVAVPLWADASQFADTAIYTFYGRFGGWDGRDDRVPIPAEWAQRFLDGGPFAGGAELIVFRQPNHAAVSPTPCNSPPEWIPLQSVITTMNENGGGEVTHGSDAFGLATQRVSISDLEPAPSGDFGLIRIEGDGDQLWVQSILTGLGRFGVGLDGAPVRTLCGTIPPSAQHTTAEQ